MAMYYCPGRRMRSLPGRPLVQEPPLLPEGMHLLTQGAVTIFQINSHWRVTIVQSYISISALWSVDKVK